MIGVNTVILLGALLSLVGLLGMLLRKNLIIMLMNLEIMFLGAIVALVGASRGQVLPSGLPEGAAVIPLILAVGACEVCVGLTMIVKIFKQSGTFWVDEMDEKL